MSHKTKSCDVFIEQMAPPAFSMPIIRPVYHFKDGNHLFIITTDSDWYLRSIIEYDLDKQQIIQTHEAQTLALIIADVCIDRLNEIIYIVTWSNYMFISFNIKTSEWNLIQKGEKDLGSIRACNCSFIQSPVNELHFIWKRHFKYDMQQNKAILLNDNLRTLSDDRDVFHASLVYHHGGKKLLMLQNESDKILYCDRNDEDGNMSDFKEYPLSLPRKAYTPICHILAWDKILFWFDYEHETFWKIWCLDLENNNKWYQSQQTLPDLKISEAVPFAIKDDNNNLHLMTFEKDHNHHFKASLFDFVPPEIIRVNRNKFDPLIIGFVKEFERNNQMIFLPMYLKRLIVQFYPIFV